MVISFGHLYLQKFSAYERCAVLAQSHEFETLVQWDYWCKITMNSKRVSRAFQNWFVQLPNQYMLPL